MSSSKNTFTENQLIEEAYAATLDPTRLQAFERFWEAYIDAQLQSNPHGIDLDNTPLNAHIAIALDILNRLKVVQEEETLAQEMVNSHYGFGFIVDDNGGIIVANDTATLFIQNRTHIKNLDIDQHAQENISSWMKKRPRKNKDKLKLFDVYLHDKIENRWLLSPIKMNTTMDMPIQRYFLVTAVSDVIDLKLSLHIIEHFKLTIAETDVANLLCNGLNPKEIAQRRGVKIAAVRTQIVHIKEKTGARDIPDLVRIVTTMAIRSKAVKSQLGRMESIRRQRYEQLDRDFANAREMHMTLRDGRNLQYFEQGHPKGTVIMQIHSLISGVQFPESVGSELISKSYRMVSPARAGFGKTDSKIYISLKDRIDASVDDILQLLDHLNIEKCYLLTGWAGPIVQRFALKYPKRCSGLIFSGAVPVWQTSFLTSLQPRYRNIIKTSIHAPKAVPYLVRVAKALIDSGRTHLFIDGLDAEGSIDKAALKDTEIYKCVEYRYKFLIEQGVDAFVAELPLIHSDWTLDAKHLVTQRSTLPITIVMGSENKDQPPEAIERYLDVLPHAEKVIIKGAGTYQNLTHFSNVLGAVDDNKKPTT